MLVLVNGLPYFSKNIVADLNEFDDENTYVFCNTYESKFAKFKFICLLPFAKAMISFNGVSDESSSLNWAMKYKKKLIMQWHGTDVLLANQRMAKGTLNRRYIDYASHLVSAPWFVDELKGIVSEVNYAPFGYVFKTGNSNPYQKVSVLTYLAKGKESFYGYKQIIELAENNPDVDFKIVGTDGENLQMLDNVSYLGWVNESTLMTLMKQSSIFIRLTEHDGKAITVSQALSVGCEVIWSYPFENCYHYDLKNGNIQVCFDQVKELVESRGLVPNQKNIEYAKATLLRDNVLTNYLNLLKSRLND